MAPQPAVLFFLSSRAGGWEGCSRNLCGKVDSLRAAMPAAYILKTRRVARCSSPVAFGPPGGG